MSGKSEKKLRRIVSRNYVQKAEELQDLAVRSWLANLLKKPFKIRMKVAWTILRGAKTK